MSETNEIGIRGWLELTGLFVLYVLLVVAININDWAEGLVIRLAE